MDLPGAKKEDMFRQVLAETLPLEQLEPGTPAGATPDKKPRAKACEVPDLQTGVAVVLPVPQGAPLPPIHLPFTWAAPSVGDQDAPKGPGIKVDRPTQDLRLAGRAASAKPDFEAAAPRTPELAFAARLTDTKADPTPAPAIPTSAAAKPTPDTRKEGAANPPTIELREKAAATTPAPPEAPVTVTHSTLAPVDSTPRTSAPGTVSISKNIATALAAESPTTLEPTRPEPLRDIALRLTDQNQERVEVRLSDRGGDLRVAVHAADAQLTRDLRDGLGDLVNRLERSGFQAETWKAASTVNAASESDQARDSQQFSGGRDREGGNREPRREADEQSQSRQQKPQWLEEMNRRFED